MWEFGEYSYGRSGLDAFAPRRATGLGMLIVLLTVLGLTKEVPPTNWFDTGRILAFAIRFSAGTDYHHAAFEEPR